MSKSDLELEQELIDKGLTAPRVTLGDIEALMARVVYHYENPEGTTSTFAHAFLDGTFYLLSGHSGCVSPENFNLETGKDYAMRDAAAKVKNKLWELEGYHLWLELNARKALAAKYAELGFADYQIRVLHERDQIRDRLTKLVIFLESNPDQVTFVHDRELLKQQRFVLENYMSILEQRISLFVPIQPADESQ